MEYISRPSKIHYLLGGGLVIGGVIFLNCFTTINAGERGVLMYFGKVQDSVLGEGIHFKLPIVSSVKSLNVRVQKTDIEVPTGTKDLQTLNASLSLNWHIDPTQVNKVYQRIGDEQQITETIIKPAITEVLKAATPKKTAEEILKKRADIKTEIDDQIKARLATYGLIVDDASLVNVGFSEDFKKSIEAKQIAEQEAKQAEFVALKAKKDAEAEVNRAKGQSEAQRLLRQTLTAELLQKQAIEKWNGQFPTVMSGNGALPFINITPAEVTSSK
jgi:regulator of protease activity HflC (stomatin/prohibitin superfamily)